MSSACWSCSTSSPETGSEWAAVVPPLACLSCLVTVVTPAPRLEPVLYRKCQGDASRLCHTHGWNGTSDTIPAGAVFSCLYRHAYRSVEQGRRVRGTASWAARGGGGAWPLSEPPPLCCSSPGTVRWRCSGSSTRGRWT